MEPLLKGSSMYLPSLYGQYANVARGGQAVPTRKLIEGALMRQLC